MIERLSIALAFALALFGILFAGIFGCAGAPSGPRKAECHVLKVEHMVEQMGTTASRDKWLAWCGEGCYVVFHSTVTPGEVVRFTEYQEDNQLQIQGRIEGRP